MKKSKKHFIAFRATDEEFNKMNENLSQSNCNNMSSYLRHIAVNGKIIVYHEE